MSTTTPSNVLDKLEKLGLLKARISKLQDAVKSLEKEVIEHPDAPQNVTLPGIGKFVMTTIRDTTIEESVVREVLGDESAISCATWTKKNLKAATNAKIMHQLESRGAFKTRKVRTTYRFTPEKK